MYLIQGLYHFPQLSTADKVLNHAPREQVRR
jgi:hypothetical protein